MNENALTMLLIRWDLFMELFEPQLVELKNCR